MYLWEDSLLSLFGSLTSCLTRVQLESISSAAGRYPLTVLTVDGIALEAGKAATRLLCHRVLRPLHETLYYRAKQRLLEHRGPVVVHLLYWYWRSRLLSNKTKTVTLSWNVNETRSSFKFLFFFKFFFSIVWVLTWVTKLLLEAACLFRPAGLVLSTVTFDTDGLVWICAVRKHAEA